MTPTLPLKDTLEMLDHTVTVFAIIGAFLGWYLTRKKRQEAGMKAIEQIDIMATNCIPTIQKNGIETNKHLTEQTPLLQSIDKGIAILVDRGK